MLKSVDNNLHHSPHPMPHPSKRKNIHRSRWRSRGRVYLKYCFLYQFCPIMKNDYQNETKISNLRLCCKQRELHETPVFRYLTSNWNYYPNNLKANHIFCTILRRRYPYLDMTTWMHLRSKVYTTLNALPPKGDKEVFFMYIFQTH